MGRGQSSQAQSSGRSGSRARAKAKQVLPVVDLSQVPARTVAHYRRELGYAITPRLAAALDAAEGDQYLADEKLLNVYTPHWRELTPGVINGEAEAYFGFGACALLALELHQQSGYPLVLLRAGLEQREQEFVHCCVRTPEGELLDIYGATPPEDKLCEWRGKYPEVHLETMADARACLELTGDDFDIYNEGELAAAHDFAGLILSDYKTGF